MSIHNPIKTIATIIILVMVVLTNGCKEVGPSIDLTNGHHNSLFDTTYIESPVQTAEAKNVLIEDFTGIQCTNCPASHVIVENLITSTSGRVIGVALHTTFQDDPLPESKQVLTSADAQTLLSYLHDPGFKPSGAVDRTINNTSFGVQILDDKNNWSGYTQRELNIPAPVNILLTKTYDAGTKKLAISVELHYTAAQTDSNKLSIFLTEDSIVTSQLLSDQSDDSTYIHNLVFRATVTNMLGDKINANLTAGTVVRKIYSTTLSSTIWKPEHMHIVAFVHKYLNGKSDVLQAKTVAVK